MNSLENFIKFIPPSPNNALIAQSNPTILTDMESKARKFTNSLNECLYEVSNEPSLGFYRIQEHVRKTIPQLIDKSNEMNNFKAKLQGNAFDLEYSLEAIVNIGKSDSNFDSITKLLTDSLYSARHINIRNMKNADQLNRSGLYKSPRGIPTSKTVTTGISTMNRADNKSPVGSSGSGGASGSSSSLLSSKQSKIGDLKQISRSPQRSQTMLLSSAFDKINETNEIQSSNKDSNLNQSNTKTTPEKILEEPLAESNAETSETNTHKEQIDENNKSQTTIPDELNK